MKLRLSAPIEIENLLPYDFNFRIIDKTAGQDFSSFLRKGGTTPLHVIENGHLLLFNVHILDTGNLSDKRSFVMLAYLPWKSQITEAASLLSLVRVEPRT